MKTISSQPFNAIVRSGTTTTIFAGRSVDAKNRFILYNVYLNTIINLPCNSRDMANDIPDSGGKELVTDGGEDIDAVVRELQDIRYVLDDIGDALEAQAGSDDDG